MGKVKQNEGLINACKFCVYPTSIEDKTIDIPERELESGSEELSVRYLISNYGFKIQSCIGEVVKKAHFEPELSKRIEIIKKGFTYKNLNTNGVYVVLDDPIDGLCIVRDIDGRSKDKTWKVSELLKLIKNGSYTFNLKRK